jgi:hypothetical protein
MSFNLFLKYTAREPWKYLKNRPYNGHDIAGKYKRSFYNNEWTKQDLKVQNLTFQTLNNILFPEMLQ